MSFIGRITARATPARNLVTPKGYVRRAEQMEKESEDLAVQTVRSQKQEEEQPINSLRRQEQEEETMQTLRREAQAEQEQEETTQPLRRQAEEEEEMQTLRRESQPEQAEEPAQALRRQAEEEEEEEEEEEPAQALQRQAEEEEEPAQALRRQEQEEEESLQTLRRQAVDEEESLQTLRRQSEEEEEEIQALRRTVEDPDSLDPGKAPMPEETRDEAEMPALSALHREALTSANTPVSDFTPVDPGLVDHGMGIHAGVTGLDSAGDGFDRPSVQIDQLDVLIHEPAQTGGTKRSIDRSRSIRTRYLRRL